MPKSFDEAQTLSKYIAEAVKRRALRAIAEHDVALAAEYDRLAEELRRDFRASGVTLKEAREIIERRFGASFERRRLLAEDAIRAAARESRTMDQETFDAIFGDDAEAAKAPSPFAGSTRANALLLSRRRGSGDK